MEARFLRELCHDVAAPAAAIRLLAERVAAESPAGSRLHDTLRQIAGEATRISDVCEYFVGAPSGASAQLEEVAEDAAASARLRYSGRIEVVANETVIAAVSPVVATRILANLLDNACRAAGPQGTVRVVATNADTQAKLTVIDSGPGFGRAEAGKAGLGLRIVADLVQEGGGTLVVGVTDSGGASVTVTLARAPDPPHVATDSAGGIGVVICDPHQAFADALAALLASAGWHVLGCTRDISEAAAISDRGGARACVTELVPSDLTNPPRLAAAVASARRTAFAALTGSADPAVLRQALTAGVRGLALKSDEFSEIRRVLERCVASHDPLRSGPVVMSGAARGLLATTVPSLSGASGMGAARLLTPRESEALAGLVRGESTEAIAAAMGVRVATARGYLDAVLSKLGVHSRIEAVALAVRAGLIEIPAQRSAVQGPGMHVPVRRVT